MALLVRSALRQLARRRAQRATRELTLRALVSARVSVRCAPSVRGATREADPPPATLRNALRVPVAHSVTPAARKYATVHHAASVSSGPWALSRKKMRRVHRASQEHPIPSALAFPPARSARRALSATTGRTAQARRGGRRASSARPARTVTPLAHRSVWAPRARRAPSALRAQRRLRPRRAPCATWERTLPQKEL